MKLFNIFLETLYGVIARCISFFIPVQSKHWIFGANFGKSYGEGPRNLMKYVVEHDPSITCTYITQNINVYKELKDKGVNCRLNFTFKGILAIAKSDCVFVSHTGNDILYAYKKKNRQFFYLMHGQAFKVVLGAVPISYWRSLTPEKSFLKEIALLIRKHICNSGNYYDSYFVSACSDFIAQYTRMEFPIQTQIKVLGSPRNDVLFDDLFMVHPFFSKIKDKFIISYMPTHRLYGKGKISPVLFIDNEIAQEWMRKNNIIVLIKQHPNMIPQIKEDLSNDVIVDITKMELDPHLVIYHSDVLITDYSSVWMDYLLLRRPLLFYLYDKFGTEDAGYHYDLSNDPAGHICETQTELFELVKRTKDNYEGMCPSERIVKKYHKYVDGKSSERHYLEIIKRYN